MKAVIMAGGFGTRLRPLTNNVPKPMIPMVEQAHDGAHRGPAPPARDHRPGHVAALPARTDRGLFPGRLGVRRDDGVCLRQRGFRDGRGRQERGGACSADPFLVISGDVLTDFDLGAAIAFHRERQAELTILLTRVENPLQYGVVITEPDGRISRFLEKPTWSEVFSDTVNTGIYVLEPSVLELIPPGREFDFSKDLFPLMMREGRRSSSVTRRAGTGGTWVICWSIAWRIRTSWRGRSRSTIAGPEGRGVGQVHLARRGQPGGFHGGPERGRCSSERTSGSGPTRASATA